MATRAPQTGVGELEGQTASEGSAVRSGPPRPQAMVPGSGRGAVARQKSLTIGAVFLNVRLNDWNRRFFEMLQNKDTPSFFPLILEFSLLAAVIVAALLVWLWRNEGRDAR